MFHHEMRVTLGSVWCCSMWMNALAVHVHVLHSKFSVSLTNRFLEWNAFTLLFFAHFAVQARVLGCHSFLTYRRKWRFISFKGKVIYGRDRCTKQSKFKRTTLFWFFFPCSWKLNFSLKHMESQLQMDIGTTKLKHKTNKWLAWMMNVMRNVRIKQKSRASVVLVWLPMANKLRLLAMEYAKLQYHERWDSRWPIHFPIEPTFQKRWMIYSRFSSSWWHVSCASSKKNTFF